MDDLKRDIKENISEDEAFKKYKIKAFLWDQFILPLKLIFNIKHIKTALLIISIFNLIVLRNYLYSWIIPGLLLLILVLYDDIYKSWKSGEFIKNYKDHKYPAYRKAIKEIRKARKERLNGNIEEVKEGPIEVSDCKKPTRLDLEGNEVAMEDKNNYKDI